MPTSSRAVRGRLRAAVLGLLTLLAVLVPAAVAVPVASAAPCNQSNCPENPPDDPTPHGPPPPHATHRLTIKKIVCYDTNDNQSWHFLSDEVYINFNGQRVWGTVSVDYLTGTYTVDVTKDVVAPPGGSYLGRLEMWDHDDTSADDKLAGLNVYGNGSPTDISGTYDFHMSDSHYSMEIGMRQL